MAPCGGGAAAVLRGLVRVVHMGRLLHRRHRRGRQAGPAEVLVNILLVGVLLF